METLEVNGHEIEYEEDESIVQEEVGFLSVHLDQVPDIITDAYWGGEEVTVNTNGKELRLEVTSVLHDKEAPSSFTLS